MVVVVEGGLPVALLSSLESVLIKKDWFYSKCAPEGSKHVLEHCSHEGNEVGVGRFRALFLTHTKKRVLYSTVRRF